MKKYVGAIIIAAGCLTATAENETIDGITWSYTVADGEASICNTYAAGDVVIPSSLGGRPVTSIGSKAFQSRSGLTSVVIPDSVTSIGDHAFAWCSGLTNVTIGAGVTNIMEWAFYDCNSLTNVNITDILAWCRISFEGGSGYYANPLYYANNLYLNGLRVSDLIIPDGVTSIGDAAFCNFKGLTSVTIPDGVTNIGDKAFSYCRSLASVSIPNSVTGIGDRAFDGCVSVTNLIAAYCPPGMWSVERATIERVIIPDGITSIRENAFSSCTNLASVSIPNSVTNIGKYAFSGCASLTSVEIPNTVRTIESGAFGSCGLISVTIPDGVTSISEDAFLNCYNMTELTIADSVISIGRSAFQWCSSLKRVSIGNGVSSVGDYAFQDCTNVTDVVVPGWKCGIPFNSVTNLVVSEGTTSIGYKAFRDCSSLTSVTIPDGVTSIGDSAFSGCMGLTSVSVPSSVTDIGSWAFHGCSLTAVHITDLAAWCGIAFSYESHPLLGVGSLYLDGAPVTDLIIPDSVTSIGYEAFAGCSGLTSVTIPDSVTSVGDRAFAGCSGLTSVTIGDGVTSIGYEAFEFCGGLTNVTIGAGVASIEERAFSYCGGLTSITIPDGVMSADAAFYECGSLKEAYVPERLRDTGDGFFLWCAEDMEVLYYNEFAQFFSTQHLSAGDGEEKLVELVVTNACRVAFEWKCSCEPLRKGRMRDYLSFSVDGVQQDAICGEVDWTNCEYFVEGDGEHVLRWTYQKDESGSEGEDCGWVRLVTVAPRVTLSFLPGGAESGEPPEGMSFYADAGNVLMPGKDTLAWPKHIFLGWSDGETVWESDAYYPCNAKVMTLTAAWESKELAAPVIDAPAEFYSETATVTISAVNGASIYYTLDDSAPTTNSTLYAGAFTIDATTTVRAIAVMDDWFDSAEAVKTVAKDDTTFGEAVNAPALEFTTDAEFGWRRVRGESPDGYALRSGVIGHNATSRLETVVVGEGRIAFSCKVAGEVVKGDVYDGLAFLIDGVPQGELMGNTDWETNTFDVVGEGSHTLSWLYVKDEGDEEVLPDDCAWIDEVVWAADGAPDPIPPPPSVQFETNDVSWTQLADGSWRSGETDDNATNSLCATVSGKGTVAFRWKTSCEGYFDFKGSLLRQDGLSFFVDGEEMAFTNGVMSGWAECSFEIEGEGSHAIEWAYVKDGAGYDGEDCACVAGVTWTQDDVDVDVGGGKTVTVSGSWFNGHAAVIVAQGGDRLTYAQSTAANGRKVWECYVVGLDPEDTTNDFRIVSFPMKADGTPDISAIAFDPPEAKWNVQGAMPVLKGKATLEGTGEWQTVTDENKADMRFFKVEVVLP